MPPRSKPTRPKAPRTKGRLRFGPAVVLGKDGVARIVTVPIGPPAASKK